MSLPRGNSTSSPLLHWMRAARYGGVPWPTFRRLSREEQGQIVAFYETDSALGYLEETEAIRQSRRASRTGRRRT